jgi:hypothetical protein
MWLKFYSVFRLHPGITIYPPFNAASNAVERLVRERDPDGDMAGLLAGLGVPAGGTDSRDDNERLLLETNSRDKRVGRQRYWQALAAIA